MGFKELIFVAFCSTKVFLTAANKVQNATSNYWNYKKKMHLLDIWSILYYFYIYLWAIFYQFILDLPSLTLICPIRHFFRFSSIKLVSHIKMRISISGIRGCVNKNAKILNMNFRVNLSNYEGWLFVLLVLWNLHAIYRVLQKKFRI